MIEYTISAFILLTTVGMFGWIYHKGRKFVKKLAKSNF